MFTREDCLSYFEELAVLERKMIYAVNDTIIRLTDSKTINALRKLAQDEVRHYALILNVFSDFLEPGKYVEQRLSPREHSFGRVELRGSQPGRERMFEGHCANLSKSGMCFESRHPFRSGECFDIKIRLYDASGELIERKGKVVWAKEATSGLHIGGITFSA